MENEKLELIRKIKTEFEGEFNHLDILSIAGVLANAVEVEEVDSYLVGTLALACISVAGDEFKEESIVEAFNIPKPKDMSAMDIKEALESELLYVIEGIEGYLSFADMVAFLFEIDIFDALQEAYEKNSDE
jgi:hypothetical protein